jgi:hypothetical protein
MYILTTPSDNTSQLCTVEHLYGIQNTSGTVSTSKLFSLLPQVITGGLPVLGAPQSMTCDNCTKEAYNIIISNAPKRSRPVPIQAYRASVVPILLVRQHFICHRDTSLTISLADGKTPAGVSQTAAGESLAKTSTSNSNGVLRSLVLWDGMMILLGFGTLLAVLV